MPAELKEFDHWKAFGLAFAKPVIAAEVRHFDQAMADEARAWMEDRG